MAASLSSNVEVRNVDFRKGKGLYALKSFKTGDIIFEERPLVSTQFLWNELYKYEACEHCMKCLETSEKMARRLSENPSLSLPHTECCETSPETCVLCPHCQVKYCCKECCQLAWDTYHKVLCLGPDRENPDHPMNKLQEIWRNIHFPPETASIMLIAKIVAMIKQSEDKDAMVGQFANFTKSTFNEEEEIAHKLLGKEFQEQLELVRAAFLEAISVDDVQQWFTPEGFRSLFALIGRNGQGIGSSSISVWVKNCEKLMLLEEEKEHLDSFIDQLYVDLDRVSGMFLNCEGSGLYKLQSACNHSCVPVAEITFPHNNHLLALVATQDINPEEEICISYLGECELERSRHSRQKSLRDNYVFNCNCARCIAEADDPDVTSEEDMDEEEDIDDDISGN